MKTSIIAILCILLIASCEASPVSIQKDPSGSGGNSSSHAASSSSSSSSVSSTSSGQGNGGSDPGLPCNPCENIDGTRLVRQRTKTVGTDGLVFYNSIESIYDTVQQTICMAIPSEDGIVRCMPATYTTATVGLYFEDSLCTVPLGYAIVSTCNPSIPKFMSELVSGSSCNDVSKYILYSTGSEYVGPLYIKSGNMCTSTLPQSIFRYYTVGNKISPSDFVPITVQTVP